MVFGRCIHFSWCFRNHFYGGQYMIPEEVYLQVREQGYGTPEQEAIIATNSWYSYCYARDVIKGRWEPGEAIIATYAYYSYLYASNAIKGRFPLCESIIAQSGYWKYYLNDVPMTDDEKAWLILRYGPPK